MSVLLLHSIRSSILQNNAKFLAAKSYTTSTMLVLTEEVGSRGVLTLNRPKSLNALSKQMVDKISETLTQWNNSKSLVIVKSNGGKAFSAGGDVRSIVEVGSPDFGKLLFRSQYATSFIVGSLMIPYVALIDGVTMGAGVGMSALGRYCIATEKTLFAMPETAMGNILFIGKKKNINKYELILKVFILMLVVHIFCHVFKADSAIIWD